jgi:thiamine pyrophosphokinase
VSLARRAPGIRRAALFLNGDYAPDPDFYLHLARSADLIVAADGGAERLAFFGLRPDVAVGDFDSLSATRVAELTAAGVRIVRHPVRKDQTDAELAVQEALCAGAKVIDLAGALGGAFDHSLGSVALLRHLAGIGVAARLVEPAFSVTVAVAPRRLVLAAAPGARFSCLPLTRRAVVSLSGFDYELDHVALRADACRGVGNQVARAGAEVVVHAGAVILTVEAVDFEAEDGGRSQKDAGAQDGRAQDGGAQVGAQDSGAPGAGERAGRVDMPGANRAEPQAGRSE